MINAKARGTKVENTAREDLQFLGPTVKERMAAGKALRENTPRISHAGHYKVTRILTLTANGVITLAMIASLILLVRGIPQHLETPKALLRSASALWITNILVFALWYWKLDAGGPLRRDRPDGLSNSSFLFPRMLSRKEQDWSWKPNFVDDLFLAFNTSTAFSPTDTAVLSRWAKLIMIVQSLISLTIVALLAARAVNIL